MRPLSRPSRRTCGCCRSSTRRRPTRRRRSPSSSSRSRRSWAACRSWRRRLAPTLKLEHRRRHPTSPLVMAALSLPRCRPCSSCCTTRTSSTTRTCSSSGTRRSRRRSWAARCARRRPPSSRGSRRRTTSRRRSRTDAAAARQAAPVSRARAGHVPWTCPGRVRGIARLRRPRVAGHGPPVGWRHRARRRRRMHRLLCCARHAWAAVEDARRGDAPSPVSGGEVAERMR
mmetsp:Transcript_3908/g.11683  ORF Transcript_3908/g.11683 Transcript_3908/m.11683 type:complete len:229 (+) Transcript_3908:1051-1737(+)